MNLKKILNILIFFVFLFNVSASLCVNAATDIETKKIQTREKIKRLKILESKETKELYKNHVKLENAHANLKAANSQMNTAKKDLTSLEYRLSAASQEYNNLNSVLISHIKNIFKVKQKTLQVILLSVGKDDFNINTFVDKVYFQKLLLKDDYDRMAKAKQKAVEIATIKYQIESKKRTLERSVVSINTQQQYIKKAIAKNENMIKKLQTDRVAYERAEKDLQKQSASIGSYISKTTRDSSVVVASGFIRPIQGRITSPFGPRVHPIFGSRSFHSGIDIGGPNLGAIRASNSGKVIYSGWYGGYGKVVIVEHGIVNGKPITTLYAHMNSIAVSNGQKITKGQVLGYEGTTGYSTGPHCHFEVRVNGQPNNPLHYI